MGRCTDCLTGDDRIAVIIWSFRFKRLLALLAKLGCWKMDERFKKHHLKKTIKDFLKKEENRQNEVFYLEYALIEYELGNVDSCTNIINVALGMNDSQEFKLENWDEAQTNRCCLYKNLVHLSLQSRPDDPNEALKLLCEMALRQKVSQVTESVLQRAEVEFDRVSAGVLGNKMKTLQPVRHFQPEFFTDWVTCQAWFLYLHEGSTACQNFLARVLSKLEETDRSKGENLWYQEVVQELQVAVLLKNYKDRRPAAGMYQVLDQVLSNGIRKFPNNLFLLAALAKEQTLTCSMGPRWWTVQKLLLQSERAFAAVFADVNTRRTAIW
ncbi:unnamed protein product [Acanthoscelides obtectus]|uniref:Uncharacterized protein n=1 Tax=Acanthoscelides obtectus TaxID=200917 RepID=A0A9P0KDQ6_ACAOB|nr:unnamed protein product [Acanthoscelides obtectus]CAK1629324.1 hypothetical protein AOBTE_LOCUS5682 [Acanthoscelides obtectus]